MTRSHVEIAHAQSLSTDQHFLSFLIKHAKNLYDKGHQKLTLSANQDDILRHVRQSCTKRSVGSEQTCGFVFCKSSVSCQPVDGSLQEPTLSPGHFGLDPIEASESNENRWERTVPYSLIFSVILTILSGWIGSPGVEKIDKNCQTDLADLQGHRDTERNPSL